MQATSLLSTLRSRLELNAKTLFWLPLRGMLTHMRQDSVVKSNVSALKRRCCLSFTQYSQLLAQPSWFIVADAAQFSAENHPCNPH